MLFRELILLWFASWSFINLLPSIAYEHEVDPFGYSSNDFVTFLSTSKHHRVRRDVSTMYYNISCDPSGVPHPTIDFPAVIFEHENFNNCNTSAGRYIRLQAHQFFEFAHNLPYPLRVKVLTWKSIIIFPGINVTFRSCCPSGNDYSGVASNWSTYSTDINETMMQDHELRGAKERTDRGRMLHGIWYGLPYDEGGDLLWLHWEMKFHLMVSALNSSLDTSIIKKCGDCKFNQCGTTGKCECLAGYTGTHCEISPSNTTYPTENYPLYLFEEPNFKGAVKQLSAGESCKFAENKEGTDEEGGRIMSYQSMRVYFNRTVVFERAGSRGSYTWSPGTDVHNISQFMDSNTFVANPIWYHYSRAIVLEFTVKAL